MSKRSKARQVAVQMLYQVDLNPDVDGSSIRTMIADRLNDQPIRDFSWGLFAGVMEHRGQIDERIQAIAANWKLNRMAATDRAILRLGAYELHHTETPVGVVIDEAVELAKKFSGRQSSQFVNGILDRLIPAERRRPDRPAPQGPLRVSEDQFAPEVLPEGAVRERDLPKEIDNDD
ncbi:MAG TPA: transcription antitermination factor NusB [Planctomicrobium sp.]|nr:transcription antitermination factor NusB [Planctomicrobium sp.]